MINHDQVKEEPIEEEKIEEKQETSVVGNDNDVIIASYNIVRIDVNNKNKIFSITGLNNILKNNHNNNYNNYGRQKFSKNSSSSFDISIRTDSKELKIKHHQSNVVFTTKESQFNLHRKSYAVKFSRETGKAYFLPINSLHTLNHLDEMNRDSAPVDTQNLIFEDCFKIPHPTRNKHDLLRIEMKSHLYKPLKQMYDNEMIKKFFDQLFSSSSISIKRLSLNDNNNVLSKKISDNINNINNKNRNNKNIIMELINCPYWFLNKINIYDINRIETIDIKVEILMRKVQVIRFYEILLLFHLNNDLKQDQHHQQQHQSKLLNTLQSICYLIDGNWTIKSHLLYKYDTIHDCDSKQLIMKKMIAAREYLLYHFIQHKSIKMIDIIERFKKINDHEEILNRLTIRNGSMNELKFILEPDSQFISNYPLIAKKHHDRSRDLLANKFNDNVSILNS